MLTSNLRHGLPPAGHQSLSSTVAMRTSTIKPLSRSTGLVQTRSHWGWRRPGDYASHIDPMFHRFVRFRSLKTRAKQIDKLRRRGRWDWDAAERPFFNAKHVRFASHFGSPRYRPLKIDSDTKKSKQQEFAEEDAFELSEGEKEWKEQMKRLRKRVEEDPYEAVFGKRFPSFWTPLLNPLVRWTGEERGHTTDQTAGIKATSNATKKTPTPVKSNPPSKKERDLDNDTPNGQLTNYSYSASTAWDSKTNKTRGQEWDSVSGVIKSYEYDPITNRMVQIEKPPSDSSPKVTKPVTPSSTPESESRRALALPKDLRTAIEVPTAIADNKTTLYSPPLLNTSMAASPAKTSAITKSPESDLDLLTAEDIRASMRGRQDRAPYSTRSGTVSSATLQPALHRMQSKEIPEPDEPDDSSAHESTGDSIQPSTVPREWDQQADLLQANRILRTRGATDDAHVTRTPYDNDPTLKPSGFKPPTVYGNGRELSRETPDDELVRVPADNDPTYKPAGFKPPTVYSNGRKVEEDGRRIDEHERTPADNDSTLNRFARFNPPTVFRDGRKVKENDRDVTVDELARTPYNNDPTMDSNDSKFKPPTVYMNGCKVEENGMKSPSSAASQPRPVHDSAAGSQSRYQQKILDLKRDLDLSYEQSTINSEMHVERIRELERALQKARGANLEKTKGPEHVQGEGDFDIANVAKYAKDSSKWYKRPTYQLASSQHKAKSAGPSRSTPPTPVVPRDVVMQDALARTEREYGITYNEATEKDTSDLLKEMAEKDRQMSEMRAGRNPFPDPHSVKVDRLMAEKYRHRPEDTTKLLKEMAEQARQIKETRAGRNPFPDPLSAKVDRETAEKYWHKPEDTKKLLAEYAEQDRQIRESRAGRNPFPDPLSSKVDKEMAEKYKFKPEDTTKLLEADAKREREWAEYVSKKETHSAAEPKLQTKADNVETKKTEAVEIKWANPPVYKILAADQWSDFTTSSNFTSSAIQESPISLQDALSTLERPGNMLRRFEALQNEGFVIIQATKDCLLLKKIAEEKVGKVVKQDGLHLRDDSFGLSNPREWNGDKEKSVRREERVVSGSKKGKRRRSELTREEIELLRKLKGNGSGWGSRLRWAMGVGAGASVLAYALGCDLEDRQARREAEGKKVVRS